MKRLILVSDESPELAQALAVSGAELAVTIIAEPPSKVVARARKLKPDLIVLDIQQPDGLELLSLLKSGMGTREIPVVVVAAEDSHLREMALEIGAEGFVAKPVDPDFLPKLMMLLGPKKK